MIHLGYLIFWNSMYHLQQMARTQVINYHLSTLNYFEIILITENSLLPHIIFALILSIYKMWEMIFFFFRKKFFWSKLGVMILSRAWHMKILIHGPAVFLPLLCTKLSGCSPSSGFLFWMNGLHPLLHHSVLIWTNQSCLGILFEVICRVGDELESWRKNPFKATSLTQWVQK